MCPRVSCQIGLHKKGVTQFPPPKRVGSVTLGTHTPPGGHSFRFRQAFMAPTAGIEARSWAYFGGELRAVLEAVPTVYFPRSTWSEHATALPHEGHHH